MTATKPPLDDALDRLIVFTHDKVTSPLHDCAKAELAQLRATSAAYREAMAIISGVQFAFNRGDERREKLLSFVRAEIAAGRWQP